MMRWLRRQSKELHSFKKSLSELDMAFRAFEKALLGNILYYSTRNYNHAESQPAEVAGHKIGMFE
jgi:hypothetical protein